MLAQRTLRSAEGGNVQLLHFTLTKVAISCTIVQSLFNVILTNSANYVGELVRARVGRL